MARQNDAFLSSIAGVDVDEKFFKEFKENSAKPAKVNGFVISSTVSLSDPFFAPSEDEIRDGIKVGKKGYVRCLLCNAEVFAPNARSHASNCLKFD